MQENECLKNSSLIYPHHKNLSLVQQRNLCKESIKNLFGKLEQTVGSKFLLKLVKCYDKIEGTSRKLSSSHISTIKRNQELNLFATITSDSTMMIIECSENSKIKSIEVKFDPSQNDSRIKWIGHLSFVDAKFCSVF